MILEKLLVNSPGLSAISYRVGGMSAMCIGCAYVAIAVLYVVGGAWPADGEGWLAFLAADSMLWWTALALAVAADLLTLPVVWAIYLALRKVNKVATLAGCSLLLVLVALDMMVTWPNCFSILTVSAKYMTSGSDAERQLYVAAASSAFETLSSPLIFGCQYLCPSIASLIFGLVTMKVARRKTVAYLGVLTGVVTTVAVVGPFFIEELSVGVFLASVLITIWFFLAGLELLDLGRSGKPPDNPIYLTQSHEELTS
jgi:hypothetical protein